MERKLSLAAGVMVALVMLSLVIDIASIAELYDLVSLPVDNLILISELIKVLALLWICRYLRVFKIIWPAALLVPAILIRTFAPEHLQSLLNLTGIEYFLSSVAVHLVGACIACVVWAVAGTHLGLNKKAQTALNGYAPVLATAAFIICVFEIVYFLETPKLIGYLCMGVGLIGLYLSLFSSRFVLAYRARSHLFTAVVGVPSVIYIMPVLAMAVGLIKDVGMSAYHDTEYWQATGKAAGPLDRFTAWQPLLQESLVAYELESAHGLFNDVWIFADGRQMAVGAEGVFQRNSRQDNWRYVYQPEDVVATAIRFDEKGTRGVLDLGYGQVATTTDGGASWNRPDLFSVFKQLTGREYGEKFADDYSVVHLDPVTGIGSFMMGCQFFSTTDFAGEWQVTAFSPEDGKTRCLADSPFALDDELGVAMTASLTGSQTLYVRSEHGGWTKRCVLDMDYFFDTGTSSCDEDDGLTQAQAAYVEKVQGSAEQLDVSSELIDKLLASKVVDVQALQSAVRKNGTQRWLVGDGYLGYVDERGSIEMDSRIPALEHIYPIDGERALGISDFLLYQTLDAGRTWLRLHTDREYLSVLGQAASNVYYLADNTLYRWSGSASDVLFEVPEDYQASGLFSSPDGVSLLLDTDGSHYWFSADAGVSWQRKGFPYPAPEINEYGDPEISEKTSFDCVFDNPLYECIALYEDGQVFRWQPQTPSAHDTLPGVEVSEDSVVTGELTIFNTSPHYQYLVAADTSQHRVLVDNKWQLKRLPKKFSYFYSVKHTPDRKKAVYWTDDYEVLLLDANGEHSLFRFGDDADVSSFCSDPAGDLIVMTGYDQLAISDNGGASWNASEQDADYTTACGYHGDYLWLAGASFSVHKRQSQLTGEALF